jgi:arylsulfatase A-like enzyme
MGSAALSLLAIFTFSLSAACSPDDRSTPAVDQTSAAGSSTQASDRAGAPVDRRPNVLLIVMDTARARAFSAYGHQRPTTPNFDRLASEGALFERAMATDFWTLPTHASLLTGLYPSDHGATSETNALPDGVETLAERLASDGYATGAFVTNTWVSAERGFARGFDTFYQPWRNAASAGTHELDRRSVNEAKRWITQQHAGGHPFFGLLNLNGAHMPYAPSPTVRLEMWPEPRPAGRGERASKIAGMWRYLGGELELDEVDFKIMRENYEAEIYMVDQRIGKLLEHLNSLGIQDDTMVIVTADHGENIGEHGRIDHLFSMHETTIHVPLVIRYPSRFDAGSIESELASQIDIMPTILDIVGLADEHLRSRSLANPARRAPEFVIAENDRPTNGIEVMERLFPNFDVREIDHRIRMIRTDRYKLIWLSTGEMMLFDLEQDPAEERDIAHSHHEIRDSLFAQLSEWMEGRNERGGAAFETTDPEALEQLKALGYVD